MNTKVTEIIPDDIPEWAKDAMDRGQLFNEIVKRGEANKWRDAKTDPPEEEGIYWCYDPTQKYIRQSCYCYSPVSGFNNGWVTHWRPLPEPPK